MSTAPAQAEAPLTDPVPNVLAELARHWGLLLTLGILSVLVGIIALVWPGITLVVFAIFFGAWLLVSGIFQLVRSFSASHAETGARVLLGISGAAGIILGLMAFRGVSQSLEILALLLGLGWVLGGIMTLVTGLASPGREGRGWVIAEGVILLIGGIVILMWPGISLVSLTIVSGIFLILYGLIEIYGAFQVRKLA